MGWDGMGWSRAVIQLWVGVWSWDGKWLED